MWRNSSGGGGRGADREHYPFHHQGTKQRNQRENERACSRAETHQLLEENRGRGRRAEPNLPDFYYGISITAGVKSVFLGSNMKSQMGVPLVPNLQTNCRVLGKEIRKRGEVAVFPSGRVSANIVLSHYYPPSLHHIP